MRSVCHYRLQDGICPHYDLRTCSELAGRVAVYYKQIATGRREATIFGSSMVIDVVIADP